MDPGSEEFPQFAKVLIDERDQWLAQQLWSCARNDVIERSLPDGTVLPPWPARVVAVVGAGHGPGMKAYWQRVAVEGGVRADLAACFDEFPPRRWDGLQKLVRRPPSAPSPPIRRCIAPQQAGWRAIHYK